VTDERPATTGDAAPVEAAHDPGAAHVDRSAAIYGSLLVTTLVAAQARHDADSDLVALTVVVSVAVFWLMELWSELVNLRVRGPITRGEVLVVARNESPMLAAAIVPAVVLAAHRLDVVTVDQAIALALAVSVAQLFLWGLAVGHAIGRGWGVSLAVATGDCLLGLLIVALKVLIIH
jgi:hypothetical protein